MSNYREFLQSGVDEYLRSNIWDSLSEGEFEIEFYASDSIENLSFKKINVIKDTVYIQFGIR